MPKYACFVLVLMTVSACLAEVGAMKVTTKDGVTQIASVPPLEWGKSGETTFCGALAAAVKSQGIDADYVTLMGDSSLAFRTRWWRKDEGAGWCPSSPVGEMTPWTHRVEPTIGHQISFNVDF